MQMESAGTIEELVFLGSRRNQAWDAIAPVLLIVAGIAAGFGIQRLIPPRAPDWLVLLVVPAPILPLWWWYANRCERRFRTALEETAEMSIGKQIQSLFRDLEPRQYESVVHDVICDAVARGNLAQTARLAVAPARNAIEPIVVPFEARVIDDTDATFEDVEQSTRARDFDGKPNLISYSDAEAMRTVRRAWKRLRQLAGDYGWWVLLLLLGALASQAVGVGVVALGSVLGLACVLLLLLVPFLLFRQRDTKIAAKGGRSPGLSVRPKYDWSSALWLVAPGGLVLRNRDRIHVLDRRTSVLVCCRHPRLGRGWRITTADARIIASRNFSQREADFFLRAWISPLRPPAVERLSDLGRPA